MATLYRSLPPMSQYGPVFGWNPGLPTSQHSQFDSRLTDLARQVVRNMSMSTQAPSYTAANKSFLPADQTSRFDPWLHRTPHLSVGPSVPFSLPNTGYNTGYNRAPITPWNPFSPPTNTQSASRQSSTPYMMSGALRPPQSQTSQTSHSPSVSFEQRFLTSEDALPDFYFNRSNESRTIAKIEKPGPVLHEAERSIYATITAYDAHCPGDGTYDAQTRANVTAAYAREWARERVTNPTIDAEGYASWVQSNASTAWLDFSNWRDRKIFAEEAETTIRSHSTLPHASGRSWRYI